MNPIKVFIETGKKRTFAGAMGWPGWCRSGRDEQSALQALIIYGPRYAQVLHGKGIEFRAPRDGSDIMVIERHEGNATTDFGAPDILLEADREPLDQREFEAIQTIFLGCWQAFDDAVQQATGKDLRKGPRGGGRNTEKIIDHVLQADQAYLRRLAWKYKAGDSKNAVVELSRTRGAIIDALEAAVHGELPEQGPRGGVIWTPRYFIRRVAWHVLDHAWEIEDRTV